LHPDGFNRAIAGIIGLELLRTGFDIGSTDRVCGILKRHNIPADLIRLEALKDGGLIANERYLFPALEGWLLRVAIRDASTNAVVGLPLPLEDFLLSPQEFAQIMATLRQGMPWSKASGQGPPPTLAEEFSLPTDKVAQFLEVLRLPTESTTFESACAALSPSLAEAYRRARDTFAPLSEFPRVDAPGIYRREHASLIIRSRTTSIIVDPVCLWRGYPNLWEAPTRCDAEIDAIFITHGHSDHFNIPSILYCARRADVPVIVPHVPRPNCLSVFDMRDALRSFGQNASAPQWWSTVVIGDIVVDILPFYGEQPTRSSPGAPPAIRNWGNCYRFNTPEFSTLVLVDSGVDPAGSMEDVVRISRQQRGDPDVLLTSAAIFLSPFFGGLMNNYMAVPVARLRTLLEDFKALRLPSVTPGPQGIPDLCAASGARYYLTYGNGFGTHIGAPILDVSGEGQPGEQILLQQIQRDIEAKCIATQAVMWSPGDVATIKNGVLKVLAFRDIAFQ
jgi:L-ascorbate metabolism protein UlaG (beta-lactamase superfamily)